MSEEYGDAFAIAYDRFWAPYPRRMGEAWLRLHATLAPDAERSVLDVGCGTGIMAAQFAAAGYRVVGVDVSEGMLARARALLAGTPQVVFLHADAADFQVAQPCAFAVSNYDIPNHIGSLERIGSYLRCVHRAVTPGGWFGFDMSTIRGLSADMAGVTRDDEVATVVVERGAVAGQALPLHIRGRVRGDNGEITAFQTTISNTAHPIADVLAAMEASRWVDIYVAAPDDLHTPVPDPEALPRVAVIARRG